MFLISFLMLVICVPCYFSLINLIRGLSILLIFLKNQLLVSLSSLLSLCFQFHLFLLSFYYFFSSFFGFNLLLFLFYCVLFSFSFLRWKLIALDLSSFLIQVPFYPELENSHEICCEAKWHKVKKQLPPIYIEKCFECSQVPTIISLRLF